MTLKRGTFRVVCDHEDCDEEVDLDTEDFEEAKELKHEMTEGWSHFALSRMGFKDYCPEHSPVLD